MAAGPGAGRIRRPAGQPIAGIILAGGRSRRMGGGDKALAPLAGRPLLQHVIDRVAPQVCALTLSVERESPALVGFGLPQIPDPQAGHQGPLGGLLAAMRHFAGQAPWLLLTPCDAPFLPLDLAARLSACAAESAAMAAVVVHAGELQPTFSLWHCTLLPQLEQAAGRRHQAGFKPFLREIRAAHCGWPAGDAERGAEDTPPPFFNVNDPAALEQAGRWLAEHRGARRAC